MTGRNQVAAEIGCVLTIADLEVAAPTSDCTHKQSFCQTYRKKWMEPSCGNQAVDIRLLADGQTAATQGSGRPVGSE